VIACNVMWRELAYYAALSPHAFNLHFRDWGLHLGTRWGGKQSAQR
jgi:hypothetical protein